MFFPSCLRGVMRIFSNNHCCVWRTGVVGLAFSLAQSPQKSNLLDWNYSTVMLDHNLFNVVI